jgi:GWxTD domain-containing protein
MTLLELWVHTPLVQSPLARTVSLALAHSLWEGVLIAVLLAAALCVARSSRARYGAACAAMLLMLASFGVTLVRLMPKPTDLAKAPRVAIPAPPAGLRMVPEIAPPVAPSLTAFLPWIAPFWAAGVLFFHLRSLGGWMAARRLRRSGVCHAAGEWQQRLDGLAARVRVSRPAALLESCLADVPVVIGYVRPVILMPVGLLAGLPVAQVEAILIHELAHIRRQDYLVNLMQTFVEGLLFYHPAVWWISAVIRAERENCCDDLAVAATGDARQYAAALTALEQNRWAAHELALAATGGSLVKRIRRLLQKPERPRADWTPAISAGILVVSAGIALASWQTPPAQLPQAPIPAVAPAPDAPAAVEPSRAPVRKSARVLLAQAPQAAQTVEQQLKDQLQRELAAGQEMIAPTTGPQQSAPPSQSETNARPMTEKQRKAKEKKAREELATPYKKWLNEDVAYIITDEERAAFKQANNDEEREQFIQQFWQRRDPTPGTPENEFKTEHYRRIAYANEQYATKIPGWKTDRGRIYITFGPPDEIEDHSSGGVYARPAEEGGGTTSTFPFQQWRYRHIDGVGNNIIIEFVDPTMSGEFHMTADPSEKDALRFASLQQPPQIKAGESDPAQVKVLMAGRGQPMASVPNSANVFASVGDGPKVTVSVTAAKKTNTQISVAFPAGSGKFDIIARITDLNNNAVANLRDITVPGQLNYMSGFTIKSGSYTLTLVTRDKTSGAMQTSTVNFYVN